ncbi:glycosyltransferase [Microlunatus ginsengisoli]|uniref:glycosyltransferase n=1 Tax=Microlunatus ginsengisoli TaxID=363863 RepID=UPI003CD0A53A
MPGAAAHHDPRVLRPGHPAGLPSQLLRVRLHFRRRPGAGARLHRHHLPRHRPRCAAGLRGRRGGSGHPRPNPSRQGNGRCHQDRRSLRAAAPDRRPRRRRVLLRRTDRAQVDGDRVVYLGSVGPGQRGEILGSAHALLHPIAFAEPLGLSVVEAMATGTPVVAFSRGSMPEVVDEGVTGFLVRCTEETATAVARVGELDRATVRRVAQSRYSARRMVDDYLEAYASVLQRD